MFMEGSEDKTKKENDSTEYMVLYLKRIFLYQKKLFYYKRGFKYKKIILKHLFFFT